MHDPGLHRVDNVLVDGGSVFLLHRPATDVWSVFSSVHLAAIITLVSARTRAAARPHRAAADRGEEGNGAMTRATGTSLMFAPPFHYGARRAQTTSQSDAP